MKKIAQDDITVTTATRSEDEVRASLGAEATPEAPPPVEAVIEATSEKPDPEVSEAARKLRQEANSDTPDPEVSEAARTMRSNRLSEKQKRLRGDVALYEEHLRELGGTIPAPSVTQFNNAQHEIDVLTRRRHELIDATSKHLKERKRAPAPAASVAAVIPEVKPAAAAAKVEPKKFEFPTWEQHQAQHPDDDYTAYLDARDEARDTFKDAQREEQRKADDAVRQDAEQKADEARRIVDAQTRVEAEAATFKAANPDYDAVTEPLLQTLVQGITADDPRAVAFQRETRDGRVDHALWYFLAKNPAEQSRLLNCKNLPEFHQILGELRYAAKGASAAAAKPAGAPAAAAAAAAAPAPAKPSTDAPAPLAAVPGSASQVRSAAEISDDDGEDADGYIAKRRAELGLDTPRRRTG